MTDRRGFRRWFRRAASQRSVTSGEVHHGSTSPIRFHDADLDARFDRDGYVVIDLLTSDEVLKLRRSWDHLAGRPDWDPTGFGATIRHQTLADSADAAIRPIVGAALRSHVRSHEPFMAAYLVKSAPSGELPPHLDWRLVDEPNEISAGCWVPLEDVDASNGTLGVLRGSHHRVDFDRTPEAPGHDWVQEYVQGDEADPVLFEVSAGTAVVYDHRLAHFSPPNQTGAPRLATNTGLTLPGSCDQARTRLMAMMARSFGGADGSAAAEAVTP